MVQGRAEISAASAILGAQLIASMPLTAAIGGGGFPAVVTVTPRLEP
jgi:hypothetical protein